MTAARRLTSRVRDLLPSPGPAPEWGEPGALMHAVRSRHPRVADAVRADVDAALRYRGETRRTDTTGAVVRQAVRLAVVSDAFLAQCCYRAKARAQARRIPLLPHLLHRLAIISGQVCIGDPVLVDPGIYIPHGQVVVDGFTHVGAGAVLSPFVTVGLKAGYPIGPTLEQNVYLGTGAKVFGPVTLGAGARVGANAVVTGDVPSGATAVGVPARVIEPDRG